VAEEPVAMPIEDWIDLHTFQARDIPSVVEEYLYQAVQKRFTLVRIVHGRGIGVQREIVQAILSRHPDVLAYEDAPDRGSTTAYLKQKP